MHLKHARDDLCHELDIQTISTVCLTYFFSEIKTYLFIFFLLLILTNHLSQLYNHINIVWNILFEGHRSYFNKSTDSTANSSHTQILPVNISITDLLFFFSPKKTDVEASPASPCEGSVTTMSSTPPTPSALQNVRILEISTDDGHGLRCFLYKDSIFYSAFAIVIIQLETVLVSWARLQLKVFPAGHQLQAKCNQKGLEVEREEFFSHHAALCLPKNSSWLRYEILHSCFSFNMVHGCIWYIIYYTIYLLWNPVWTFSARENWLCKFHQISSKPLTRFETVAQVVICLRSHGSFRFQLLEESSR